MEKRFSAFGGQLRGAERVDDMSSTCIQKKPPLHPSVTLCAQVEASRLLLCQNSKTQMAVGRRGRFRVVEGRGAVLLVSRKSIQLSTGRSAAFIHVKETREARMGSQEELRWATLHTPDFCMIRISLVLSRATLCISYVGTMHHLREHELRHSRRSRPTTRMMLSRR